MAVHLSLADAECIWKITCISKINNKSMTHRCTIWHGIKDNRVLLCINYLGAHSYPGKRKLNCNTFSEGGLSYTLVSAYNRVKACTQAVATEQAMHGKTRPSLGNDKLFICSCLILVIACVAWWTKLLVNPHSICAHLDLGLVSLTSMCTN